MREHAIILLFNNIVMAIADPWLCEQEITVGGETGIVRRIEEGDPLVKYTRFFLTDDCRQRRRSPIRLRASIIVV
jgi:hypothetical protein